MSKSTKRTAPLLEGFDALSIVSSGGSSVGLYSVVSSERQWSAPRVQQSNKDFKFHAGDVDLNLLEGFGALSIVSAVASPGSLSHWFTRTKMAQEVQWTALGFKFNSQTTNSTPRT